MSFPPNIYYGAIHVRSLHLLKNYNKWVLTIACNKLYLLRFSIIISDLGGSVLGSTATSGSASTLGQNICPGGSVYARINPLLAAGKLKK